MAHGANLSNSRIASTLAERSKVPSEIRGKGNRGAWVAGFKVGAEGLLAQCPYAVSGPTVSLRRSWMMGWQVGHDSIVKKPASRVK